jgi:hypothetical protein
VEEIIIDPTLGVLAPRTEVSEITTPKSPVAHSSSACCKTSKKQPTPTSTKLLLSLPSFQSFRPQKTILRLAFFSRQSQTLSFRPEAAHLPLHWRNLLLQLNRPADAHSWLIYPMPASTPRI